MAGNVMMTVMPKLNIRRRRSTDVNVVAHELVAASTREEETQEPEDERPKGEPVPNPTGLSEYLSAIGRKGGKVGGKRRLKTMTAAQRKKSAQKAAKARWKNAK